MKVVSKTWPVGARFSKNGRGECRPQDVEVFRLRNEKAEAVERIGHVFATEAHCDPRHGWVDDFIQQGKVRWLPGLDLNLGDFVGGRTEDDGGMGALFFLSVGVDGNDPTLGGWPQAGDLGVKCDGFAKLGVERVGENLEAFVEGEFFCLRPFHFGALLSFTRSKDDSAQDRAVVILKSLELGKSVTDGEVLRDSRIDAGNEGIDGVVEKFLSQSTHDKIGERLVFITGFTANERFTEEA